VSNELASNSNGSYTYDANGNTLSDPSGKSYSWDFENRLVQAVVPGTNGGTTTFRYDPFVRRIQKSGPLGTTNYLYDGGNLLEEADNSGNVLARYSEGGIDEPFAELRSGTTTFYEQDGIDAVTSLSTSTAAMAKTYSYDAFGKLTASTGTLLNTLQYTARVFDPETGIYFYRARYYDAAAGRFLSEDPIGFVGGGLNFYDYVLGNPVLFNDPFGLWRNTGQPAPPTTNSIVCNGAGGIRVKLADYYDLLPEFARCLGDCTRTHEGVHRSEALASNPKICSGSADGIQVGFSNGIEQDRSEIATYTVEIQCLKQKERNDSCPTCKGLQDSQIQKAQDKIKEFKFYLSTGN
jgi:RHS repeat-associated protein